ncbi:MAG: hypothetical protein HOI23_22935 [Deltaproteobacteria bacterium]|nr:hypothetical protein [Deltaproteobacteria bacterium]MBT6432677.1 hypothetical protein [Deltaproteobacteria bacterium]
MFRFFIKPSQKILLVLALGYTVSGCFFYVSQNEYRTPANLDPMPEITQQETLKVVLMGDTGKNSTQRTRVLQQIKSETKDYIIALGDLVYPHPPPCPTGQVLEKDKIFYREQVANGLEGLGAPVLAILGNHAYYRGKRSYMQRLFPFIPTPREVGDNKNGQVVDPAACMVDYMATLPNVHLPALDYGLDFGVAQLAFVDTNHLDSDTAKIVHDTFTDKTSWNILLGHHVLKTYHDKESEDYVRPWLQEHAIAPDLYANGHAHVLQFGIYNNVPAITSGTGAKLRERKTCPPDCGDGQLWGESQPGYATLTITATRIDVVFKNDKGEELYQWFKTK